MGKRGTEKGKTGFNDWNGFVSAVKMKRLLQD